MPLLAIPSLFPSSALRSLITIIGREVIGVECLREKGAVCRYLPSCTNLWVFALLSCVELAAERKGSMAFLL